MALYGLDEGGGRVPGVKLSAPGTTHVHHKTVKRAELVAAVADQADVEQKTVDAVLTGLKATLEKSATKGGNEQLTVPGMFALLVPNAPAPESSAHGTHFRVDFERRILAAVQDRIREVPDEQLVAGVGDVDRLADRMVGLIPAKHPYDQEIGPFYDTATVTDWLGVTRQALAQRIAARTLLGCPTSGGGPRAYPVWQFRADGSPIPHLGRVLDALAKGSDDPWVWASWLAARSPHRFRGRPAWQWLDAGGDPDVVVAAAREDAARWVE